MGLLSLMWTLGMVLILVTENCCSTRNGIEMLGECVLVSVLREDVGGHLIQFGVIMGYIVPSEEKPIVYEHVCKGMILGAHQWL